VEAGRRTGDAESGQGVSDEAFVTTAGGRVAAPGEFYDELAPYYHLIFPDWSASIARQAAQLDRVIRAHWPGTRRVLDVACGIGTQALGLAQLGYEVRAPDLSAREVERARGEAAARALSIDFAVGDMRDAARLHGSGFDRVVCAANALPHLLTDADLLAGLRAMRACLRPGGGCLLTVRDYAIEERGRNLLKPIGVREAGDRRWLQWQLWDFDGPDHYDLALYLVEEDRATDAATTRVFRSRYHAFSTGRLCALMREAGFGAVQRLDDAFYQPVLIGSR
jgi:SAM-dependent methyltransferase